MKRFGMPALIGISFLICIVPSWLGWFSNYIQFIIEFTAKRTGQKG